MTADAPTSPAPVVVPMGRVQRLVRFVAVGVVGFAVSTAILAVIETRMPDLLASLLATEVAVLSNYTMHEFFTFGTRHVTVRRAGTYNASAALGLAITSVMFALVSRWLPEWPLVVRNLLAVGCGTASNFLLSTRFVWDVDVFGRGEDA